MSDANRARELEGAARNLLEIMARLRGNGDVTTDEIWQAHRMLAAALAREPAKVLGMPIVTDPTMPPGAFEIRGPRGTVRVEDAAGLREPIVNITPALCAECGGDETVPFGNAAGGGPVGWKDCPSCRKEPT